MQRFGGPLVIIVGVVILAAIAGGLYFVFGSSGGTSGLTLLTATSNVATYQGLKFSVEPALVPQDFRIGLNSVPADQFSANADDSLKDARAALPDYLAPASPIYLVNSEGPAPAQMTLALTLDSKMGDLKKLDVYAWDGGTWKFLPSRVNGDRAVAIINTLPHALAVFQSGATAQVTSTTLEVGEALGDIGSTINVVAVAGPTLQADGTLVGDVAGGFSEGQGYAVLPVVRTPDDGGAALNTMLATPKARSQQIGGVVDLVNNGGYNGVVVEYRGLDPARGPAFTQFIADLATALHQQNKSLSVVSPQPTFDSSRSIYTTGGYNLRTIALAADVIELPLGDDLAAVNNGSAARMIGWAVGEVSRYKLRLATSALSVDSVNGATTRIPANSALTAFGSASLQTDLTQITTGSPVNIALTGKVQSLGYDANAFAPRFTYTDDAGTAHIVTYVTPESLTHQLALAQTFNLGGVSVRDLFNPGNPAGMIDALVQYKVNNAALTSSGASLSYTVSGANGVVLQATGLPGQPFTWTAGEPGQYAIAANLQSSGGIPLGSVDVVVPQVTIAPLTATTAPALKPVIPNTPLPTSTPCVGCPTATPVPTQAPVVKPPVTGGGGAWGTFELGGQVVHGGIPHAAEMKRAKMVWVKIQISSLGADAGPAITNAHAQGFKILISFLGIGAGSQATDPGYQQQVAAYLGAVAGQGADAIEVWNEANLDRDWPSGQTSGAAYTAMLKASYQAIKAANSNTIVISGAPSPTGSNGGGCGAFCDDKPWLEQFVAAGGLNYSDCVGIHYNEGIVSPRDIGNDPRDNHYTRYFQTMVNTYASIIGNARPLCFTELGYLTGDGYPDLASTAPGFAWAAGNSIAEQAQWLAETASIARGGSAIRMIIVFNIDYSDYGQDPKAGFAILRADGSCPACDSLGAVMP